MAPNKPPSFLTELRAFAANLGEVPYEKLLATATEAGWEQFIQETGAVGQPDGCVLVTFQVFVGKEGRFEPFDQLSVKVSPGPGPVSAVARRIVFDSLVPLFFGRYPVAAAQLAPVTTVRTDDTDIVLPAADDGGEYVIEPPAPLNVVARHEPDGVPIFADLYALGDPYTTKQVVEAVLDAVDDFLQRASSVEQINAMGIKNPLMIKFIADLGEKADSAELKEMIDRRRNEVAPPVLATTSRRRSSGAPTVKAN